MKTQIKRLLYNIDDGSTGYVKFQVFKQLLDLNKISLSQKNFEKLRLNHRAVPKAGAGDYTDLIDYKEALRSIKPNLDKDEPLLKEWILSNSRG